MDSSSYGFYTEFKDFITNLSDEVKYDKFKPIIEYIYSNSAVEKLFKKRLTMYENLLSKSYISTGRFCKKLYKKYIIPFINIDAVYCRDRIVNHIDMEPLMESFEIGFANYFKSYWCKKIERKIKEKCKNLFDLHISFSRDDIIKEFNIFCLNACIMYQYKKSIMKIIKNHRKYHNLSIMINDCEFFYMHNARTVTLTCCYFVSHVKEIEVLKQNGITTENYEIIKNKILNMVKYINQSYEKISDIISEVKTIPKEYNDSASEIIERLFNMINEYSQVLEIQKSNVFNFDIIDCVKDWFNSSMNFLFRYDRII